MLQLVETGVTYITDRGYVALWLYHDLMERGAYFVVRERNNLQARVLAEIEISLGRLAQWPCLRVASDQVIQLRRGGQTIFRLVQFTIAGHHFQLATNRWDLTTEQIIRLYAWRWQVELIFRAWKHTLGGLHLINLSEVGIAIQFHLLLLASLLWVVCQQEAERQQPSTVLVSPAAQAPATESRANKPKKAQTPTAFLSEIFQVSWRLLKPALRLLANCLTQPFSVYLAKRAELRL